MLSQHTVKEKIVKFQKPWYAGRFSAAAPIFGGGEIPKSKPKEIELRCFHH